MSELFEIEPSLSPRLQWMAQKGVLTSQINPCDDSAATWSAWDAGNRCLDSGMYKVENKAGFGMSEIEAVQDLACRMGALNWISREKLK